MYGFKHEYTICNIADGEAYLMQCAAIEKHIPGLKKLDEIQDVDGSRLQKYLYSGNTIRVYKDNYINAVHVGSDIPLEPFFEKVLPDERT